VAAPDVSIVIVTYECRGFVRKCLTAIPAAAAGRTYEVIVADNDSSDGVVPMLRERYPDVRIVEMGSNTGFARANNRAIGLAQGRAILLLNPDTTPSVASIGRLAKFLERTPAAGVVAPRLLNPDLSDQGTARSFPTAAAALFGRRSALSKLFPSNPWSRRYLAGRSIRSSEPFQVDWVSGAAMMVRREVIDRVGGLDEGFFMHWEDADWCHRIKDAGYGVYCLPAAHIVHAEGGSRRGWPPRQLWAFHRGAYRYYAKHHAHVWNPLRYVAFIGLSMRALAMISIAMTRASFATTVVRSEETR
jgi:N-acetylglucosaminyl-diphospho-decaprenol L-rhamnosyltransferase